MTTNHFKMTYWISLFFIYSCSVIYLFNSFSILTIIFNIAFYLFSTYFIDLFSDILHLLNQPTKIFEYIFQKKYTFTPKYVIFHLLLFIILMFLTYFKSSFPIDFSYPSMILMICNFSFIKNFKKPYLFKYLDGGSMLAFSYYHGYLKYVIPDNGQNKGLEEKINDYCARNQLDDSTFPSKKLFVLIPKSAYIPPDLKAISYNWMEPCAKLEALKMNNAGNIERIYENCVYKIAKPNDPGKATYVVAEGATPIKTLYEILKNDPFFAHHLNEYKEELIEYFYLTLKDLITRDLSINDNIELIYYEDMDNGNNKINVANLILEKIDDYFTLNKCNNQRIIKDIMLN